MGFPSSYLVRVANYFGSANATIPLGPVGDAGGGLAAGVVAVEAGVVEGGVAVTSKI